MATPSAPYSAVDDDQPGRHPTVGREADVDPAGSSHGTAIAAETRGKHADQSAGERVGGELGDHHIAPAGRGEEGGGDRLVAVLAGHPEHAEQDGETAMTAAGPPIDWTRVSGPSGSLPCLPERLRMAT